MSEPILEAAAQGIADATSTPPVLYELGVEDPRKVLDELQAAPTAASPQRISPALDRTTAHQPQSSLRPYASPSDEASPVASRSPKRGMTCPRKRRRPSPTPSER